MIKYIVPKILNNMNIRDYFAFYHVSSSEIYKLIINKKVLVNKESVNLNTIIYENDIVEIIEYCDIISTYDIPLDVIYEDDYILVVYKQPKMLIHSDGNSEKTLCNVVANYYKNNNINCLVRYAHRIDYDTQGLVLFTKGIISTSFINYQINTQKVVKKYRAICHGIFNSKEGKIDFSIGKNRHNNSYIISKKGKNALTLYKVIGKKKELSLLELQIKTGRTHQIRVHLSSIKHPIVSDRIYYKYENCDLMLQSYSLKFIHPYTLKEFEIKCPKKRSLNYVENN